MGKQLVAENIHGGTAYFHVFNPRDEYKVRDVDAPEWEAELGAEWAHYTITATADDAGTGVKGDLPTGVDESLIWYWRLYLRAGGSPASTDQVIWEGYTVPAQYAANLTQINGVAQSATDLKDFADTGYDPSTHKVQGVVTTDTATTVTNPVTVGTNNDKTGYRLSATGVDDIWDEAQSGHTTAGTFGLYLDATVSSRLASAGYTTPPTVGAIADQVWDEATSGHTTSGTFGEQLKTDVDAILDDTGTAGVVVNTFTTPGKAELQQEATDALNAYDPPTRAEATSDANSILAYVDLIDDGTSGLAKIATDVAAILVDTGTTGVAVADKSGYSLSSSGLDAVLVEASISAGAGLTNDTGTQLTSINARQALALCAAALEGVLAGAAGTTITIKPAGKPSGNTRITATVDSDGNRTALTLKVPD